VASLTAGPTPALWGLSELVIAIVGEYGPVRVDAWLPDCDDL
jgi:hypothetical protein